MISTIRSTSVSNILSEETGVAELHWKIVLISTIKDHNPKATNFPHSARVSIPPFRTLQIPTAVIIEAIPMKTAPLEITRSIKFSTRISVIVFY